MGSGVDFHPEARVDIDEIADFIARDGSIDAARQVVRRILDAIDALVPFPHQGHHRTDLTSRPLRFWRVYDYLVAYAPDERPLWVMAVMHGHRSPRLLAAILRSREADPTTFGGKSASAQSLRKTKRTLVELFEPLRGLDVEFSRNPSTGRPIDL